MISDLSNFIHNQADVIATHFAQSGSVAGQLGEIMLLSVSDGMKRAKTVQIKFSDNLQKNSDFYPLVAREIEQLQAKFSHPLKWAKLEWVESSESRELSALQLELKNYKRNYFRLGIAFQYDGEWLLLPESELNAHACLYAGADVPVAQLNAKNLQVYFKNRFDKDLSSAFFESELAVFKTAGLFFDLEKQEVHPLSTLPRTHGRRVLAPLSADSLANFIEKITAYLGNQVQEDQHGKYEYGYFPCFGRTIGNYNTLRHASSTYALLEGYEFCREQQLGENHLAKLRLQIELALDYLTSEIIREYPNNLAYAVEINNEIKLGANAVAILALTKYVMVFADADRNTRYLALAEKLANGIVNMQKPDGSFVHILDGKTLKVLAENRIIYYDGEASFGLMRLYGITKDPRWIECVRKAFDYFVQSEHNGAHDHWLSYCSNELAIYSPERKYFEFAVNNVKGYVNFIRNRITTFPTLLELSMAFHKMLLKLDEFPEYADVLDGFDVADFYQALHTRANYLMNGVFFPEVAMNFRYPNTVLYGCFIRHHSFRVRIDDVEHYLSGLIAYHQLLASQQYPKSFQQEAAQRVYQGTLLGAEGVELATGGKWVVKPTVDWQADGMSIFPKRFRKGHLIVARGKNMDKGYLSPVAVKSLVLKGAAGIICDNPEIYLDYGVPVLKVANVKKATLDIGAWVRKQYLGGVVGVTGSAGKTTTVAMLAHALSIFGGVGQSLDSANLPAGIAWNLSMMDKNAKHWILEMAIGSMDINSRMVQPDIAIITNIAPAHLEYHKTVEMVAVKKARIFEGMKPQSRAIICRDIEQFDILSAKALSHHLQLTTYGEHPESDIRLVSIQSGVTKISLFGKPYSFKMQTKGKHIVLNALAVLAVIYHRGLDMEKALKQLVSFKAVEGRGEVFKVVYQGKAITVIDEAYNANPISMRAAVTAFGDLKHTKKRKLAIIGDMLELGPDSQTYHLDMLSYLVNLKVREFVFVGEMCRAVSDKIAELGIRTTHFENVGQLSKLIGSIVQDGDMVLIKASNGIGLQGAFSEPKLSTEQSGGAKAVIAAEKLSNERGEIRLVHSFNANEKLLPASLTKVLSLMVVWDKIVKESIDIHTHQVRMPVELLRGSSEHYQFFHLDEKIEMVKLLQSSLIVSSNEAIYALALWHSGDEQTFVQAINQKAVEIGMKDSLFMSASGLIRKGHTTAQDMLTMAVYFIDNYPELTAFGCLKSFTHNGKKLPNTNRLLHSHPEVRGLKTGNLVGIGANLINYFVKDDKHYVSVVLLAPSRAECFDISEALMKNCLGGD